MVKEDSRMTAAIVIAALTALLVLASVPGWATASGHKRRHRYLPVRCQDPRYHNVIEQTGAQLVAQYSAMGFNMNGAEAGEACGYVGTRHLKGGVSTGVREGNGFMNALSPPFPGETNPAIREYDWKWKELVSNTKKGVLHGTVESLNCTKYSYDIGGSGGMYNVQSYPC